MRRSFYPDWIAWSLLTALAIVVGMEYYLQRTTGLSTPEYVYKIVVTPTSTR